MRLSMYNAASKPKNINVLYFIFHKNTALPVIQIVYRFNYVMFCLDLSLREEGTLYFVLSLC